MNLGFKMSDWFKFYNDTLDDPKFQYAISEYSQVTSVYLLILSEASKKRSGSIPWKDQDFELFGFSRKINVTVPILNECLNLLVRIGYINKDGHSITVTSWSTVQSDYCKGLSKGYYGDSTKKLASNSEVSSVRGEERRGDQIKRDQRVFSASEIVVKNKELERVIEKIKSVRSRSEAHTGLSVNDRAELTSLREREKALKADLGVVVGA